MIVRHHGKEHRPAREHAVHVYLSVFQREIFHDILRDSLPFGDILYIHTTQETRWSGFRNSLDRSHGWRDETTFTLTKYYESWVSNFSEAFVSTPEREHLARLVSGRNGSICWIYGVHQVSTPCVFVSLTERHEISVTRDATSSAMKIRATFSKRHRI